MTVDCGSVPSAGSNSVVQSSTGTTQSSTVTYQCNIGYGTNAGLTLTCEADGQWSGNSGPDCTGITLLLGQGEGVIRHREYSHFMFSFNLSFAAFLPPVCDNDKRYFKYFVNN